MKVYWKKSQPLIILRDYQMLRYESRVEGDEDVVSKVTFRPEGDYRILFKDDTYTHANRGSLTIVK